jgi:hypothetical protein
MAQEDLMSSFHTSARICAPLLAVAALAATTRANLIVVDIDGGADFTEIQAAVDAASDGDTIRIELAWDQPSSLIHLQAMLVGPHGEHAIGNSTGLVVLNHVY